MLIFGGVVSKRVSPSRLDPPIRKMCSWKLGSCKSKGLKQNKCYLKAPPSDTHFILLSIRHIHSYIHLQFHTPDTGYPNLANLHFRELTSENKNSLKTRFLEAHFCFKSNESDDSSSKHFASPKIFGFITPQAHLLKEPIIATLWKKNKKLLKLNLVSSFSLDFRG